jgi:hypothetical protein
MDEIWKPIPGRRGYEASDLGNIRSTGTRGRVLRQFTLWSGYKTTHLSSKHMNNYVHRLVALAFMGKSPKGMHVCHNNGIKSDNRLVNLRFDTRSGNMRDVARHRYEQAWLDNAKDPFFKQGRNSRTMG